MEILTRVALKKQDKNLEYAFKLTFKHLFLTGANLEVVVGGRYSEQLLSKEMFM